MADFKGSNNPAYRHGLADTATHRVWVDMRQRCENPNRTNFKYYGARGIAVCERWQVFENFLADMGIRPTSKHSIERIDNDGNYEPANCKWATVIEQRYNNRANRWIVIDGIRRTIGQWATSQGIDEALIRIRIKRGINERDAVLTPIQPNTGGRRLKSPQFPVKTLVRTTPAAPSRVAMAPDKVNP